MYSVKLIRKRRRLMKIKRLFGAALLLIVMVAICLSVTACVGDNPDPKKKTIEGVSFVNKTVVYDGTEHEITVMGELPEGVSVTYTDNKGTDAGQYDATATLVGEGYETLTLTAKLTIEKKTIEGVTLSCQTFTYDGTLKSLQLSGELPEGVTATWIENGATNAGNHPVKVTLSGKNYKDLTLSEIMVIEKADITGIVFVGGEFTYDGEEKKIEIEGTLPEGVSVSYTGNVQTEVGEYPVTATLSGDNYNTLTIPAVLIIKKADNTEEAKDFTGITLESDEFTYDGTVKSLSLTGKLPEGTNVTFAGNDQINAGEYRVVAVLSAEGYNTLTLEATLKINKLSLADTLTLEDKEVDYEKGKKHSLVVEGEIPDGVTVTYSNENIEQAGIYTITVIIEGDNYERLVLTATLTVKGRDGSGFITPEHKW